MGLESQLFPIFFENRSSIKDCIFTWDILLSLPSQKLRIVAPTCLRGGSDMLFVVQRYGAYLAIASGILFFLIGASAAQKTPTSFTMPNVVGMTVEEAEKAVAKAGQHSTLRTAKAHIEKRVASPSPAGQIISQLPASGEVIHVTVGNLTLTYFDQNAFGQANFAVTVSTGPARTPINKPPTSVQDGRGEVKDAVKTLLGEVFENGLGRLSQRDPPKVDTPPPTTPSFIGKTLDEANVIARSYKLELVPQSAQNFSTEKGLIFSQSPRQGADLPEFRQVAVSISDGWPLAPDFINMTRRQARIMAGKMDIPVTWDEQQSNTVARGRISSQTPVAGEKMRRDLRMTLTVSSGWPTTPNFITLTEGEALDIAAEFQITLEVERAELFGIARQQVADQTPEPAAPLPQNRQVRIIVADGWPVAPNVVNTAIDDAEARYNRLNLIIEGVVAQDIPPGTIISQEPLPGSTLNERLDLTLLIAEEDENIWPLIILSTALIGGVGTAAYFWTQKKPLKLRTRPPADRYPLSSVQLRVQMNPQLQEFDITADDSALRNAVTLQVHPDPGVQTIEPADEGGDRGKSH